MAGRDWSIEAEYVEFCSCDHGCPCEAMAPPTMGLCEGIVAFRITKGHCEGVSLDGLIVVATFFFPRAIHHGGGHMHPIIGGITSDEQTEAIFYILSGEDQPAGTMFNIFSIIIEQIHDPIFTDVDWKWNLKTRKASIKVGDIIRAHAEPIRNPVTDTEQRILTVLPEGWVFHEAENASGFAKGMSDLKFDLSQKHSSLANVAWGPNGLTHTFDEYKEKYGRP
ncbi:MAG: DUF1326 domain-containing protein [Rhodospirillales bacterium]|nr:DUF1326 domain-containing protein [Rhodospirillales bacterium]MBT4040770.1 DUF1326 domain-containing protein [Rhodospirillales bacterium]MBT4628019.1 DUF1326 domain-containing protein [Rhodospirillales bacterium]MBT5351701.1 DUF1326 domain-containing protein [Rhodospirillales bacterium]MBT5520879.1 DUF1326 domain-containing protein [Rhodospirillales bacterium]